MSLRPFCRATDHPDGLDVICHRMAWPHLGSHVMRFEQCDDRRPPIRWYSAITEATNEPPSVALGELKAVPACPWAPETLSGAIRADSGGIRR